MQIGTKVIIKWSKKCGEIIDITSERLNSPYPVTIYHVKNENGVIEKCDRKEIRLNDAE